MTNVCRLLACAQVPRTLERCPRHERLQIPGGLYHLGTRGNRRCPIFLDDDDRVSFFQVLERVAARCGWLCHAYCLMTNHYHLLIETPEPTLSDGMQMLNGRYARSFNEKHGLRGHLFERRFYDESVDDDTHLLELSRYLARNPVRAGICERAGDWRWSSFLATTGVAASPRFLTVDTVLGMFGRSREHAVRRYTEFVEDMAR